MTTDPFTEAAHAEAERRYMLYREYPATVMEDREIKAHIGGWEAARTFLAEQEPTDAEVEAAAESLCGADMEVHGFSSEEAANILHGRWVRLEDTHRNAYLATARAALSAARAARRDEKGKS